MTTTSERFGDYGLIGASGRWYPCDFGEHLDEAKTHGDYPYVLCSRYAPGEYTMRTGLVPNRAQFETVMAWCAWKGKKFEDVAIAPEWGPWEAEGER